MKILLGVSGCIAAYKACEILRGLQKEGADVEVVLTKNAAEFVGPTTFAALSGHPCRIEAFGDDSDPIPHIRMAQECGLFLIAPCTANVAAKIANGIADDLLTSTALAAWDHLAIAPAMNVHMYNAPSTQGNLRVLRERGVCVIEPDDGYLACGDVGKGRLADVDEIVSSALSLADSSRRVKAKDLAGKKVLVTAGPTIERIDAVRFLTNDSSGKMGYAIAQAAAMRGADVTLVSGPVSISAPAGLNVVNVSSADEMLEAASCAFADADIAVFAAAVADMRPKVQYSSKLKKGKDAGKLESIELVENPDILATLAAKKKPEQLVIGFAAETDDLVANAKAKLSSKGADIIVANDVGNGRCFGADEEAVVLVTGAFEKEIPVMSKFQLANEILDEACANIS